VKTGFARQLPVVTLVMLSFWINGWMDDPFKAIKSKIALIAEVK
jgi:hypothetical protein